MLERCAHPPADPRRRTRPAGSRPQGQVGGQHMRGHDRQEDGPLQRGKPASGEGFGVQPDRVVDGGPGHVQVQRARLMNGQMVQEPGDLRGDPGPHQHIIHIGKHRPVRRTRRGHLNLLQEVDPDHAVMTLLGQPHLGEVGHYRQLQVRRVRTHAQLGDGDVRLTGGSATFTEVPAQHSLRYRRHRERRQGAPRIATHVSILQPSGDHDVQCRPRDHAELAKLRHHPHRLPRGHSHTHAAQDDHRPAAVSGRYGRG